VDHDPLEDLEALEARWDVQAVHYTLHSLGVEDRTLAEVRTLLVMSWRRTETSGWQKIVWTRWRTVG